MKKKKLKRNYKELKTKFERLDEEYGESIAGWYKTASNNVTKMRVIKRLMLALRYINYVDHHDVVWALRWAKKDEFARFIKPRGDDDEF